mgnify:CR=1 FL=1
MGYYPNRVGHYRDGLYRKQVTKLSSGSASTPDLVRNIDTDESGTVFVIPRDTTAKLVLPSPSSKWLGLTYEFVVTSQASTGDVQITCTGNYSVVIRGLKKTSDLATTDAQSASLPTTEPVWGKVTLVSSVAWEWEQRLRMVNDYTSNNDLVAEDFNGMWTTGTTS